MEKHGVYTERVTSLRTSALFLVLSALFNTAGFRRLPVRSFDLLTGLAFFAGLFFLFYLFNFRVLHITITHRTLTLTFGIFSMRIQTSNIADCLHDTTSLWRIGGAGIHFSWIKKRYRAMFNFLEHPRLVLRLREKKGPVRDVAFTTCHPEKIRVLLHPLISPVRSSTARSKSSGQ